MRARFADRTLRAAIEMSVRLFGVLDDVLTEHLGRRPQVAPSYGYAAPSADPRVVLEHAEHLVAVDQEPRDVGDGRGLDRLLLGAGLAGEEVALGLGEILEAAELLADPGGVDDAHVEAERLRQPVELQRVSA